MQRKNVRNKRRIVTASLAGLLTVAVVSTALYKDSSVAFARPSLPGIEGIINSNSTDQPFRILEIVDDYPSARIGYMIAGEEPGDVRYADAISDTASLDERADRYMTAATTTKNTDGYKELDGYAFTYTAFEEKDPGTGNPYVETDDGVKNGKSYGSFVENTNNDGRYDPADISGDYKQVNDGTPATNADPTKPNLTIEEVYRKVPGSDQTGLFFMHYAGVLPATATSAPADRYDVTQYEEIDSDTAWKYPFALFSEDRDDDNDGIIDKDSDGNDIVYTYYDQNRYVVDLQIEANYDPKDVNVAEDDEYSILSTLSEGNIIYIDTSGDTFLEYAGFVKDDGTGTLVYEDKTGVTMPLQGKIKEAVDADDDGNQDLDGSGNPIWADVENLAHIVNESTDTYCTVRVATGSDGAAVTKYHISKMVQNNTGLYERFTGRFQPVNDPAFTPETFGIVDENEAGYTAVGTPWYHVWYYKAQSTAPYNYNTNSPQDGKYDFVHDYSAEEVNNYYYKGGYDNKERFKTEVLDVDENDKNKLAAVCIDVVTKKTSEVTAEDIANADLVYFTGSNYTPTTGDMSFEAATALLTSIIQDSKAVVINYSCCVAAWDLTNNLTNMDNMFWFLSRDNIDGIANTFSNGAWNGIQVQQFILWKQACLSYSSTTNKGDISHVIKSVFFNDDINGTDAIDSDFVSKYTGSKPDGFEIVNPSNTTQVLAKFDGFKEVKQANDLEKFYLDVAGKDVDEFNDDITKATSIRHILNYGNKRTVGKTALRVLDIEPFYARDVEGDAEDYANIDALTKIYKPRNVNGESHGDAYTVDNIAQIRDIFTKNWFKSNVSDTSENIDVIGMGTREFVGKIEDLNESYDLIYIGMDTAYQYTDVTVLNNNHVNKSKNVVMNNGKHYVYCHTGDYITPTKVSNYDPNGITKGGTWNLSGNDITPDKLRELQNYVKSGYAIILSDEFFKYNSDGTAIKDDENSLVLRDDRIEPSSHLYKFIKWACDSDNGYLYKNVEISKNFESTSSTTDKAAVLAHKESFVNYLNISKLEVDVIEQPPLYNPYDTNDNDKHYYLAMNNQGKYTLDYKIKLTNDAAVDTTNTSYDCKLYIDHDADGRFESVEALDSLEIINIDSGDYINLQDDGKYHLTTGTTYTISRAVPEGYVGLISWKLVFVENRGKDDAQIKTAVQDYSAISDLANKPTIHVLQLTQWQNNGDIEPNGAGYREQRSTTQNSTTYNHLDLEKDPDLVRLYGQVTEFNLDVDVEWVENFVTMKGIFDSGKNRTRLQILNDYDIVVLGFTDSYWFCNDRGTTDYLQNARDAILSLREYAISGKSILFTHDLTTPSHTTTDTLQFGVLSNRYLRDIQGMDRYGFTEGNLKNLAFSDGTLLSEYHSVYDNVFREDSAVSGSYNGTYAKIGYSNQTLLRYNSGSNYADIAAQYTYNTDGGNRNAHRINRDTSDTVHRQNDERQMYSVKRLNRGQMTEYPFRIGSLTADGVDKDGNALYSANEYIETAYTHHQWYQLNLDTDYTDEYYDDDVVVWYTLTEPGSSKLNYHRLDSDDARNNYYIYNKGNITYTGAGHWWIYGDEEKKLFVNTLVASYNAGKHAPYASYKSDDTIIATDITSTYIPYDISFAQDEADGGEEDGWIEDSINVYFKTVNNNLQDNVMPLITQYYVEVPTGGDIKIDNTWYKIITPKSIKECTVIREGTVSNPTYRTVYTDVDDPQVLGNGKVYKLEFDVDDLMNGNRQGVNERYHAKIYTRMRSQDKKKTIDEEKEDMASTGTVAMLPANDSMKGLNINFTQLYDLR